MQQPEISIHPLIGRLRKINTLRQFPISMQRMFLGRKSPEKSFLGDAICFWEHFGKT
jgi:hypothetical protein